MSDHGIESTRAPSIEPVYEQLELFHVFADLVRRHLANTDPDSRGVNKVLTVSQLGNDWNFQAPQKTHEHLVAFGTVPGAIRNDSNVAVASV